MPAPNVLQKTITFIACLPLMPTDPPPAIDPRDFTFHDCVTHIRSTLADLCVREYNDKFSFFRFLNRATFLFNTPLCFAVCERLPDGRFLLVDDKHTVRDPLFEDIFHCTLRRTLKVYSSTFSINTDSSQYLIRLFSTDYYVIPFIFDLLDNKPFQRKNVRFIPITNNHPVGEVLTRIFQPFGTTLHQLGVERRLRANFEQLIRKNLHIPALTDDPRDCPATSHDRAVIHRYAGPAVSTSDIQSSPFSTLSFVLNNEINALLGSCAITPSVAFPAVSNLLLTYKCFDRDDARFDTYYYDIKFFVSSFQRQQIHDTLLHIQRDLFLPFHDECADKWFWETVDKKDADTLLRILTAPLSRYVRLFADDVLTSGAGMLCINPFSSGDLGWIDERASDFATQQELRRFAVLHYLFQSMLPEDRSPSLLTLPLRVSGATWMAATVVVSGQKAANTDVPEGVASPGEFEKRFLIYHSILRDFERRLRRKTRDAYIEAVYDLFITFLLKECRAKEVLWKRTDLLESEPAEYINYCEYSKLNSQLVALCRLYPFDLIVFGPEDELRETTNDYVEKVFDENGKEEQNSAQEIEEIGRPCGIALGIVAHNRFFDRLNLRAFLDRAKVGRRLRDLVNAEIGLRLGRKRRMKRVE